MFKWIVVLLLLMAALTAAAFFVAPKFKPKPTAWKTEKVGHGDIQVMVTSTGTVNPIQTVFIGSQVSGRVKDVLKTTNDVIKKGEVLATLETDLLESEKRSCEVRLSQVRAALNALAVEHENLDIRELRQKAAIERKKISVERARASMELAAKNLRRIKDLLAVDAATLNDLDIRTLEEANSKRDLKLMEIDLEQSDVDDKQIKADRKQLLAKEEQARADIQQAEAQLARSVTNLGYATIVSPIDGVVLQHLIEPGQTMAASFQTPNMFKLASDLSKLRIDAQLDEADIGKIVMGQNVAFDVDAYRGEVFNGSVAQVRLQSESKGNLVTYPVLVAADNVAKVVRPVAGTTPSVGSAPPATQGSSVVEWKLLPGMSTNLRFVVDQKKDRTLLPCAALRFIPPMGMAPTKSTDDVPKDKDKKGGTRGTVFVVNAMGLLEGKSVLVGETDGDNFELLEGDVKEGTEIVVGVK